MERLAVGGRGGGGEADPAGRGGERRRAPSAARSGRSARDGRPRCWSGRRPGTPCRTWRVRRSPPAAPDAAGFRRRNPRPDSASRRRDAPRPAGTCRGASVGVARAWTRFQRKQNDSRPTTACRQRSCRDVCCMPKQGGDCHATVRRHPGDRRHACAGGAVRGLPTRRARRRRHQGRASRRSRPEPRLGHRQGAQPQADGHAVPDPGLQQALAGARPQARARPRNPESAGQDRRRVRRELPARRVRGARPRLRRARRDQPAADLRLVLGVRPERPARRRRPPTTTSSRRPRASWR